MHSFRFLVLTFLVLQVAHGFILRLDGKSTQYGAHSKLKPIIGHHNNSSLHHEGNIIEYISPRRITRDINIAVKKTPSLPSKGGRRPIKCSGIRAGTRSRLRAGSRSRLRSRTNLRSSRRRCRPSRTQTHLNKEEKEFEEADENEEGINEEENGCPDSQGLRSKRGASKKKGGKWCPKAPAETPKPDTTTETPKPDATLAVIDYEEVRGKIVEDLNARFKDFERINTKPDEPLIYEAIKEIKPGQNLETDELIRITDPKLLKVFELDDPSYVTMKKLRAKWTTDPEYSGDLLKDFEDQIQDVKAIKDKKQSAGPIMKPKTLKHIFRGVRDSKKKFSGLHDGSVFYNTDEQGAPANVVGAHKIIGGTVLKVSKMGPGVAVDIEDPKILWNGDTEQLTKQITTIFLGVPPRFQAALYLTAFLEAPKNPSTKVTVIDPKEPSQVLLSVKVDNNVGKTGNTIKSGYPVLTK